MEPNRAVTPPAAPQGKVDCFESIRGLAALSVLLGHLIIGFFPELYTPSPTQVAGHSYLVRMAALTPFRVVWEAQWAVSTFFVLSGFVLTLAFFRSGRTETTTSAAVRRYLRLMIPASAAALFAYALLKYGLMYNHAASEAINTEHAGYGWWLGIFYSFKPSFVNALKEGPWAMFFGSTQYNQSLWTMAPELEGSFLVYAFVALFGKVRNRWFVYAAVSFLLVSLNNLFMWNFILGALVADLYAAAEAGRLRFRLPFWAALPVVAGAVYLATVRPTSTLSVWKWVVLDRNQLYQSIASFLLVGVVAFSPLLRRILETRVLRFLGRVSFGLYLVHLPLLCSLGCGLYLLARRRFGWAHGRGALFASLGTIGVALVLAWAFYHCVDRPTVWLCKVLYQKCFAARPPAAVPAAVVGAPLAVREAA